MCACNIMRKRRKLRHKDPQGLANVPSEAAEPCGLHVVGRLIRKRRFDWPPAKDSVNQLISSKCLSLFHACVYMVLVRSNNSATVTNWSARMAKRTLVIATCAALRWIPVTRLGKCVVLFESGRDINNCEHNFAQPHEMRRMHATDLRTAAARLRHPVAGGDIRCRVEL